MRVNAAMDMFLIRLEMNVFRRTRLVKNSLDTELKQPYLEILVNANTATYGRGIAVCGIFQRTMK